MNKRLIEGKNAIVTGCARGIGKSIVDLNMFYRGGGVVTPLYLYPESSIQKQIISLQNRISNMFSHNTIYHG